MSIPTGLIDRPRFSVVTWVDAEVEPIDDLIACIDAQRFDAGRVEVIVVDRRPTDGPVAAPAPSPRPASPGRASIIVVAAPAARPDAARNMGLDRATASGSSSRIRGTDRIGIACG